MLKQRIVAVLTGLALLIASTGSAGIIADSLGQPITPQVFGCESPSSSGGGC